MGPADETLDEGGPRASSRPVDAEVGSKVDRYTVLERAGDGAAGAVYAAYDPKLDRKVALKILRYSGDLYEARLLREAQAMARLSHPNVVAVYDTGRVGDRLFLAMEFVDGVTLRAWQRAAPRAWGETLDRFVAAGRGLAAAHARGLVHRDFKPDNVLVADSGEVKVTDFGIVRATNETVDGAAGPEATGAVAVSTAQAFERGVADPSQGSLTSSLDAPITEDGSLLGTPGYMAPEQYLFEPVDERTDQFAFSVALYEALYGERPFAGDTLFEMGRATIKGEVREPSKATGVPARVRRVLLRGLSSDREQRYPSLVALLADLTRDPARERRRAVFLVLGVLGTIGVTLAGQRALQSRVAAPCTGGEALANEVWNADARARIGEAMTATGLPFASDSWDRTRTHLDAYMGGWISLHRQICEATRVRGEQSEALMGVRLTCLEQRRREVGALTTVLRTADRAVTSHAVEAALGLAPLDRCQDVASLTAVEPEPAGAAAHAKLDAVRTALASVVAELESGKVLAAREQVEGLVPRARTLAYRPLLGEVLLASARVKAEAGGERDVSVAEATEAVFDADVGRADTLRARAATELLGWTIDAGHRAAAEQWSRVAEAALDRVHDEGDARIGWLVASAAAYEGAGKYVEAKDRLVEALALARRSGSSPQRIADTERLLAGRLAAIGETDEASRLVNEASDSIRRVVGDAHPSRIPYLLTMGYVAGERGDFAGGLKTTREAIALAERIAPDHSRLPTLYNNESNFLFELHDYEAALSAADRTVASALRVFGADAVQVAYGHSAAGSALLGLGRFQEAQAHYALAVAIHEKSSEEEADLIEALVGLGRARAGAGTPGAALPPLERALALLAKTERTGREGMRLRADAQLATARALWESGSRSGRALDLARAALETRRATGPAGDAREIQAWIDDHAPRGSGTGGQPL